MADLGQLKLFVGGLSGKTSDVDLREHFSRYGAVVESVVAEDRDTGARRGFGFVTFSDSAAFDRALGDSHFIRQRKVDVKKAVPRGEQLRNHNHNKGLSRNDASNYQRTSNYSEFRRRKIFVGGLSPSLTEIEFKSYFEQFGGITDAVVMHDNNSNRARGFGFITFESEESVKDVTRKNFYELGGKFVEVKRALPKDEVIGNGICSPMVENGKCSFTDHHLGNCLPNPDAYITPSFYRTITGNGGALVYPYGPPCPFAQGFSAGGYYGVGYEMGCVEPTSPLMSPPPLFGFGGSPLPFGTFYAAYSNVGPGVLWMPNCTVSNGFTNVGLHKN